MTAVAPDSSFATRVEVRAQSLFLAFLVVAQAGMWWQITNLANTIGDVNGSLSRDMGNMNATLSRDVGALTANSATLIEMARDHGNQLRSLNDRMASLETRIQELAVSIGKLVPKP